MSQEQLNGTDVCALLEEMDRKCMSQRMRGDGFGNVAEGARVLARMLNRIFADVLLQPIAGKEPMWWFFQTPPVTEDGKQFGREHHVAILHSFALLDAQDHALAINGRGSQTNRFGDAQAGCIAGGQNYVTLGAGDGPEKFHNFFGAKNDWQFLWLLGRGDDFFKGPVLFESDFVKETQRAQIAMRIELVAGSFSF